MYISYFFKTSFSRSIFYKLLTKWVKYSVPQYTHYQQLNGTTWVDRASRRATPPTSPFNPLSSRSRIQRQAQATTTPKDDIPVFDRNKVSLDFPGNLFGPSVSLLIRSTKIIGDVIQNSAVRYQTFLRLFRPLFRGPFEIKGLDPPTTTTTSTTARPAAAADNEVRRRRHLPRHA